MFGIKQEDPPPNTASSGKPAHSPSPIYLVAYGADWIPFAILLLIKGIVGDALTEVSEKRKSMITYSFLIHFLHGEKHADMNLRLGQIFMAMDFEGEMVTGMRMS